MKVSVPDNLATEEAVAELPLAHQDNRQVARRIFKNTAWQYANNLVSLFSGLLMVYILSRYLGVVGYGKYNLVLSFVPAFQVLSDWGVTTTALREIAKDRSRLGVLLGNLFWLRLALTVPALLVCWSVALLLNYPGEVRFAIFIFSALILLNPLEVFGLVFQVDLRGEYTIIPALLTTVLNFGLISAVVIFDLGLTWIFGAIILTNLLRMAIVLALSRRFARPAFKLDFALWRKLMQLALPLGLSLMVSTLYQQTDLLLLSRLDSPAALGIYSAGLRLTNFVAFIPLAVAASLFPLFSNYYATDRARLRNFYQKAFDYMVMLALPLAVFTVLLADKIVAFLLKPEFGPTALVIAVNIWATALLFPGIIAGNLLIASDRQKTNLRLLLVVLALDIALDLLLIPIFSYLGAAIANTTSVFFMVIATLFIAGRLIQLRYSLKIVPKVTFIVALLVPPLLLARELPLFIILPSLIVLFFGLVFITKTVSLREIYQLRSGRG